MKFIALIGMPGSGKSTIGRAVTQKLNYQFLDSDDAIEQSFGCSIPEIFEQYGEEKFREAERNTILDIINEKSHPFILSTGGGAFMNEDIRANLLSETTVFYLQASLDKLWQNIQNSYHNRPLLKFDDPKERISKLLQERESIYQQAHEKIDCNDKELDEIISTLIERIET